MTISCGIFLRPRSVALRAPHMSSEPGVDVGRSWEVGYQGRVTGLQKARLPAWAEFSPGKGSLRSTLTESPDMGRVRISASSEPPPIGKPRDAPDFSLGQPGLLRLCNSLCTTRHQLGFW